MYSRKGDRGQTTLKSAVSISKADERVNAMGTVEELASLLHLICLEPSCPNRASLEGVVRNLKTIADGIRSENLQASVISASAIEEMETYIDHVDPKLLVGMDEIVVTGTNVISSGLDMARALARRAERSLARMGRTFPVQANTSKYINRLSDYLFAMARTAESPDGKTFAAAPAVAMPALSPVPSGSSSGAQPVSLQMAKQLIEGVEAFAKAQNKKAVIAVVNSEGNPIAVHVMDDAFLISFEVALKKAYTAVSVKMSTMELSKLVQPGQTFYGLQNLDRIVAFGGGVPLKIGDKIVGGLGISGGTGEEDHALCELGLRLFGEMVAK